MPRAPPLPDVLASPGRWGCWSSGGQLGSHPSAGTAGQGSALEPPWVVFNLALPRSGVSSERPGPRGRGAAWQGGGAGHQRVSEVPLVAGSAWRALRAAALVLLGPGGSPPCRTGGCRGRCLLGGVWGGPPGAQPRLHPKRSPGWVLQPTGPHVCADGTTSSSLGSSETPPRCCQCCHTPVARRI